MNIIKTHHFGSTLRTLDFSFEATSPREVNPVANKNFNFQFHVKNH